MSNPARRLHSQLLRWRKVVQANDGKQSVYNSRGESETAAVTLDAFGLLVQVQGHVDSWEQAGRDVTVHRRTIESITKSLLSLPSPWREATRADTAYPQSDLDSLALLAELIDFAGNGLIPPLAESNIQAFLDQVATTLSEDETLEQAFRDYMASLIAAVSDALEHKDADRLRDDFQHLYFAVFAAEEVSKEKGKWVGVARTFGWQTATLTMSSLGAELVVKAITGG